MARNVIKSRKPGRIAPLILLLLASALPACTRLKGTVMEEPSGRPMRTAVFSVGRPGGIAAYATHRVDERGNFDFTIAPMDLNNVYLYDGAGDPETTLRHIDSTDMSERMQLRLRRAAPPNLMVPTNININP